MRNISDTFVQKIETRILYSDFFRKLCRLRDKLWKKYTRVRQAIDDKQYDAVKMDN